MTAKELEELKKRQEEILESEPITKSKIISKMKVPAYSHLAPYSQELLNSFYDKTEEYFRLTKADGTPTTIISYRTYVGVPEQLWYILINEQLDFGSELIDMTKYSSEEDYYKAQISLLFKAVKDMIEADLTTGALTNLYNPTISKVILSSEHDVQETKKEETKSDITSTQINLIDDIGNETN